MKICIAFCLLNVFVSLQGQKNDYVWLAGYGSNHTVVIDTATSGYNIGNIKLDFNQNPVRINYDSLGMNFDFTNTTFCNSEGNLLFYSNGIYIANSLDEHIQNGDSLNAGYVQYVWDTTITSGGYRSTQGILSVGSLSDTNEYFLFHTLIDSLPGTFGEYLYCSKILVTLLNMTANAGHGKVIYRNETLIQDSLNSDIQAIRHGNGRDWWLLMQKRYTNCWYRILLDSTGPHVMTDLACVGISMNSLDIGVSSFSPNGEKFVYLFPDSGLNIYDFDRCTGQLSNPRYLPLPSFVDSGWGAIGVAISPNSRFLYVSATYYLYQFDLWAPDIFGSIDTIGRYNGGHFPGAPGIKNVFDMQQLGPDGKIYMSCANTTPYYHVINNPDEKGDSCNFVQNVHMPALVNSVSNHPNYRLGALTQSQCDSLSTFTQNIRDAKEQQLNVFPNPANDVTTVDYGFTDWNKGPVSMEITNELGQSVYTQPLPMYSGFQHLDVSRFAAGIYMVYIKRNFAVVAAQKLVVGR